MLKRLHTSLRDTIGLEPHHVYGWILAALLVLPVLGQLTYFVALNADSRAVIGAHDDDAGNAIDIAGHSHWYRSNGFYPYGPVYFRVAHMLGAAMSPVREPGSLAAEEARSKAMHLGLMLTSVAALFALAFLLAGAWTKIVYARLGLSVWLIFAFLQNEVWRTFLLRAHPDHLLAFAVAAACLATARAWDTGTPGARKFAAWIWGLALAVKMTLLLWLPFLALTLALPWRPARARELTRFTLHAAGAFFLVGFPQNFNLYKIFRFLKQQSAFSLPATTASVSEGLGNWGAQMLWPAVVLGLGALVLNARTLARGRGDWRFLALGLGPFALLMLQNVVAPHSHYPMPIVATQLALGAGLFFGGAALSDRVWTGLLLASVIVFSVVPVVPESFNDALATQLECRPEARALAIKVNALRARGLEVHADPYVPLMSHLDHVSFTWEMSSAYLKSHHFDALVLTWPFADRYLSPEPSEYTKRDNLNWREAREVYQKFKGQAEVDLADSGRFRKTAADRCGWEIWERQ